jgi:hypothetical protein
MRLLILVGLRSCRWLGVGGNADLAAGFELDCAVAPRSAYEFLDAPNRLVFDPVRDGRGGEQCPVTPSGSLDAMWARVGVVPCEV